MQNNQSVDDDDGDYDDAEWLTNFDESIKKQMGYLHYIFILFDIMYSRHFEGVIGRCIFYWRSFLKNFYSLLKKAQIWHGIVQSSSETITDINYIISFI